MTVYLIAGGAGSLGRRLTRELLKPEYNSTAIRVLDNNENGLARLKIRLGENDGKLRFFLGDIRDENRMSRAMENVDIVLLCAAQKHVDFGEFSPFESLKTNVLGVQNCIDAALINNVDKFLFFSSDKAVQAINTYGRCKALSESLTLDANNYKGDKRTKFSICVSPETPIMTARGPEAIAELTVGEEVLTHTGVLRKITRVISRPYHGDILQLCDRKLLITPRHLMYAFNNGSFDWIEAATCAERMLPVLSYRSSIPSGLFGRRRMFSHRVSSLSEEFLYQIPSRPPHRSRARCNQRQVVVGMVGTETLELFAHNTTNQEKHACLGIRNCGKTQGSRITGGNNALSRCQTSTRADFASAMSGQTKSTELEGITEDRAKTFGRINEEGISFRPPIKSRIDKSEPMQYSREVAQCTNTFGLDEIRSYGMVRYSGLVYNLEVETDNSYCANGWIVHNCRPPNYIDSDGSVYEIWRYQKKRDIPLTLTHPQMHRFVMSFPDIIKFVMKCIAMMKGGEIFIPSTGVEEVKIIDLAKKLSDNIKIVGLRKGERLRELLMDPSEEERAEMVDGIWVVH